MKQTPFGAKLCMVLMVLILVSPFVALTYEHTIQSCCTESTSVTTVAPVSPTAPISQDWDRTFEVPLSALQAIQPPADAENSADKTVLPTWDDLVSSAHLQIGLLSGTSEFRDVFAENILGLDKMESSHTRNYLFTCPIPEGYGFSEFLGKLVEMVELYNSSSSKSCILAFQEAEENEGDISVTFYLAGSKYKPLGFGECMYVVVGGPAYDSVYGNPAGTERYLKAGTTVKINGIAFLDEKGILLESVYIDSSSEFAPSYLPLMGPMGTASVYLHVCSVQPGPDADLVWVKVEADGEPVPDAPILIPLGVNLTD